MNMLFILVIATVVFIVLFDFTNGFHDASNIVATVIASRAMSPRQAITIVAVFEFLGPILCGTAVANTIGGFVDIQGLPTTISICTVLAGIAGAITWNLATWRFGIPSSSSHALVGGLVGAVVLSAGPDHVVWGFSKLFNGEPTGVTKVVLALLISPVLGFVVGFLIHASARFLLRRARPSANWKLKKIQWLTAAGLAFAHGANDAQKSMGVLTLMLVLAGWLPEFQVPIWVILLCASSITIGILLGGWRIVKTIGFGIYKIQPLHAVNAQLTSGVVIMISALFGAPVSTTHVVSASIMGIGASERPRAVRWIKAKEIVAAWFITIPSAAIVSALIFLALSFAISSS